MNKQKGFAPILIVFGVMVMVSLIGAGYYLGTIKSKLPLQPVVTTQTTPQPTITAQAENDEIASWKTYTNSVQNYSFKYSTDWKVNYTQANEQQNSLLELTRGQEKMTIYANLVGIGGLGRDFEGTPITVSGQKLYVYKMAGENNREVLGVTDSLKQSLGVFQFNNKTYSISLKYPSNYDQTNRGAELKKEFDQILSTFKFIP